MVGLGYNSPKPQLHFRASGLPSGVAAMKPGQQFMANAVFTVSGIHKDEMGWDIQLELQEFTGVNQEQVQDEMTRDFLIELSKGS